MEYTGVMVERAHRMNNSPLTPGHRHLQTRDVLEHVAKFYRFISMIRVASLPSGQSLDRPLRLNTDCR